MGSRRLQLLVFAGLLAGGMAAGAQAPGTQPGPAGSAPRGLSSQILIAQLSLYLPEEATRGINRGFGGRGEAAGGQSAQGQAGGAGSTGRPLLQFTRDPKLYLTRGQIAGLLPVLSSLRDSPLPTPSRAKQVQAAVDGILTDGQKAEWAEFQKKMEDLIAQYRQRMGAMNGDGAAQAGGPGGPGGTGGAPQATMMQRRQKQLDAFIKVLQDRLNAVGV